MIAGVVMIAVVACGGGGHSGGSGGGKGGGSGSSAGAVPEGFYGYGPYAASTAALQPDVVLIKNGDKAIRGADGDGLTWTLDGSAPGVKDLKPGSVMVASTFATGRVVRITPRGGDVAVTLAPVQLTDIVKDGEIKGEGPLDLGKTDMMAFPDHPGALTVPPPSSDATPGADPTPTGSESPPDGASTGGTPHDDAPADSATSDSSPSESPSESASDSPEETSGEATDAATDAAGVVNLRLPPVVLAAAHRDSSSPLGPLQNMKGGLQIGNWQVEPYSDPQRIRLRVLYNGPKDGKVGVKFGVNLYLNFMNPTYYAESRVSGGQVQSSTMTMNGLQSIGVDLGAGSANGLKDNQRVRLEIPVDLVEKERLVVVPGVPFPIPTVFVMKFKFLTEMGFSSKNSTMETSAEWKVNGALGQPGMTLTQTKGFLDDMSAMSMAGTGMVVAFELKAQYGLGVPGFMAGPYGKLVLSFGLTDGSPLGMVHCESANVSLIGSTGAGAEISSKTVGYLKEILGSDAVKVDAEKQVFKNWDIYKHTWYKPDVPACHTD